MPGPHDRREFLGQLGVASATLLGTRALPLTAASLGERPTAEGEPWDMSWLDRLKSARYRAVIDASVLEDGYAPSLASGLMGDFHDVHGASDDQVRIVVVARRLGTPLVFDDVLWEKFPLGEETKTSDGEGKPYRRNPYYRAREGAPPESAASQ